MRSRLGMTQAALASATGLHRTYLSRVENGQVLPSIIRLIEIAGGLGIDKITLRIRSSDA
jgi:transcriptional regulator with XRE-family HTH domain